VRLIIMGPQGSGKGTQAALLAKNLGIPAISTGDIFRSQMAEGTPLGRKAQEYMSRGDLVPDEVTNGMVRDRLSRDDVAPGFILDGYPRDAEQVQELDSILADLGWGLSVVLELTADRDELLERLRKRAEIEGRADDTAEAIGRRLAIYASETAPLIDAYAERGLLAQVDGMGAVEDVQSRLAAAIAARIK
jgi:adenylate kinase